MLWAVLPGAWPALAWVNIIVLAAFAVAFAAAQVGGYWQSRHWLWWLRCRSLLSIRSADGQTTPRARTG
jgi:hypothetical protein